MVKKYYTKVMTICLLVIALSPVITIAVQSRMGDDFTSPSINAEDEKIYKIMLYKSGSLGNLLDIDTYHFQMKEGKTYIFRCKFTVDAGAFQVAVSGPGGSGGQSESWDSDDPKSSRIIQFLFTPTDAGEHSITVFALIASDVSDYNLYVNQDGFAGWWWMLAIGIGALLIIIIVVVVIVRATRPKKRRRRR